MQHNPVILLCLQSFTFMEKDYLNSNKIVVRRVHKVSTTIQMDVNDSTRLKSGNWKIGKLEKQLCIELDVIIKEL